MARDYSRTLRIGEQIRRELAELIRREVKDPRVGMVTIGSVDVSSDLSHARVYYTILDDDEQVRKGTQIGLEKASGFLRHKVGQAIKTRLTPELIFKFDETPEKGAHLAALIEHAVEQDATHHESDDESS